MIQPKEEKYGDNSSRSSNKNSNKGIESILNFNSFEGSFERIKFGIQLFEYQMKLYVHVHTAVHIEK